VTATVIEEAPVAATETVAGQPAGAPAGQQQPPQTLHVTTYAQLLSTGDQKTAENLAARLIDRGFTTAYVERGATDKGPIYRVRVKFDSEPERARRRRGSGSFRKKCGSRRSNG
jgi:cell division septation protein DedD